MVHLTNQRRGQRKASTHLEGTGGIPRTDRLTHLGRVWLAIVFVLRILPFRHGLSVAAFDFQLFIMHGIRPPFVKPFHLRTDIAYQFCGLDTGR